MDDTREYFRTVVAIAFVLTGKEPLPLPPLSALLGKDLNIRAIIKPMGSLLGGILNEGKPICACVIGVGLRNTRTRTSPMFVLSMWVSP